MLSEAEGRGVLVGLGFLGWSCRRRRGAITNSRRVGLGGYRCAAALTCETVVPLSHIHVLPLCVPLCPGGNRAAAAENKLPANASLRDFPLPAAQSWLIRALHSGIGFVFAPKLGREGNPGRGTKELQIGLHRMAVQAASFQLAIGLQTTEGKGGSDI